MAAPRPTPARTRPARTHPEWPEHIRARYGVVDRPRWVPAVLAAILVVAALGTTVVGWRLANPRIDAGVFGYGTVSDERLDLRFEVVRRTYSPATCVVRARAADGFDVAYAVLELPAAQGRTSHDVRLRTAYRALIGELLGCGLDGPPPGIAGAQFRPGVVPPQQPWTP
jgi:hypothetical protein